MSTKRELFKQNKTIIYYYITYDIPVSLELYRFNNKFYKKS